MQQNTGASQAQQFWMGDRESHRSVFDDKIAIAESMKYPMPSQPNQLVPTEKKIAWAKSARNYFMSKASEMEALLVWAESFKSQTIHPQHIEQYVSAGMCYDHHPTKLSRDLWGYLNSNIPQTSKDCPILDNATGGNGLDAWRRIVDPLGPRSEERLFKMHKDVINPTPARSVSSRSTRGGETSSYPQSRKTLASFSLSCRLASTWSGLRSRAPEAGCSAMDWNVRRRFRIPWP